MTLLHMQIIIVVVLFGAAILAYYPTRRFVSVITRTDVVACYILSVTCFLGALTVILIAVGIL